MRKGKQAEIIDGSVLTARLRGVSSRSRSVRQQLKQSDNLF